ncbi:MAG: protein phosphatase 2C domain-containing protein [Thermodesulfobacteriota bacterium]
MLKFTSAALSHPGLKRSNNEDCFVADETLGLFLVADGMGGAASGEVASKLASETVSHYFRHYADRDLEASQRFDYHNPDLSPRANTLLQAIFLANSLVHDTARKDERHKGMGSTLAVLMVDNNGILVVHVGDSRVYRSRDGELTRLTVDHRLADDLKLKGMVDPEGTIITRMGNTLTRSIGVRETVEPEVTFTSVMEGDLFLICSDGLSDMVQEEMVGKVLALERPLPKKAQDLIDLALAGGGRDNITAVLVSATAPGRLKSFFSKMKG